MKLSFCKYPVCAFFCAQFIVFRAVKMSKKARDFQDVYVNVDDD